MGTSADIIDFELHYAADFKRLNLEWLERACASPAGSAALRSSRTERSCAAACPVR